MATNAYPYVFISYAHLNQNLVLPAISALQAQGVSLWYDRGIEAGSEWPEFVAEKVMSCEKFVLFISNAYLQSQNCKRELNFAISRKKEILSIFLEDVTLSPGMEMQLGTYQAIFCKRFPNMQSFCDSLPKEPFFNSCKNIPGAAQQTTEPFIGQQTNPNPRQPYQTQQPFQTQQYTNPWGTGSNQNTGTQGNWQANPAPTPPPVNPLPEKSKAMAVLLAFFLGSFGAHKFYLGKKVLGILYLVFFWTYIPTFLSFFDAIVLLFRSKDSFEKRYKCRLK